MYGLGVVVDGWMVQDGCCGRLWHMKAKSEKPLFSGVFLHGRHHHERLVGKGQPESFKGGFMDD